MLSLSNTPFPCDVLGLGSPELTTIDWKVVVLCCSGVKALSEEVDARSVTEVDARRVTKVTGGEGMDVDDYII